MRTLCLTLLLSASLLVTACQVDGEVASSPFDQQLRAQQAGGDQQSADARDVEGGEGEEACYPDSNGGSFTFEADSIGDTSGTYTRRDANGDVTTTGNWSQNADGDISYSDPDTSEIGTMENTPDGYDYSGQDADGNDESGSLDSSGSC